MGLGYVPKTHEEGCERKVGMSKTEPAPKLRDLETPGYLKPH